MFRIISGPRTPLVHAVQWAVTQISVTVTPRPLTAACGLRNSRECRYSIDGRKDWLLTSRFRFMVNMVIDLHSIQLIVTDVRGVMSVSLSVRQSVCQAAQLTRLHCAGVIQCSLCQITFPSCFSFARKDTSDDVVLRVNGPCSVATVLFWGCDRCYCCCSSCRQARRGVVA